MAGAVGFVIHRLRPREGWLPLLLLVAIVACLITAVLEAKWTAEVRVVVPAAIWGFLLGTVLAKRPLSPGFAWLLLALYGWLIPFIHLASLWPTWAALSGGWPALRLFWLQNGALFLDRVAGWGTAVFNNQPSQETIVFAAGLGLLAFFLTAFTTWQLFRQRQPFSGYVSLGLAFALNGYFGGAEIWWTALFVGLAALLTAVMHVATLEQDWDANQVDYSTEVKTDLFLYAAVIAFVLLFIALTAPSFSIRQLVRAFQQQPVVQQAEAALARAFGGVGGAGSRQPVGRDGVGGSGIMPREFLLGNASELYETVVMTAVVQSEVALAGIHWRSLSYDVYTGRGWALSEERSELAAANTPIPLPAVAATTAVSQTVQWLQDGRLARYSLGLPQQIDQDVEIFWRGQTDLVRVNGLSSPYTIHSQVSLATPAALRETAVATVSPELLARYTQLPANLPQRVRDLAQEVTAGVTNPYDQAAALEQFLRQYTYSLEPVNLTNNTDPVDYFLFEAQRGYCDFFASAMVVMARTLGLPARLGIGYLAQPPGPDGVQRILQINGHSWAEIYFAGYGWIEFEPTAVFMTPHAQQQNPANGAQLDDTSMQAPETLPLPASDLAAKRPFPWLRLAGLAAVAGAAYWLWQREQLPAGQDVVIWCYGRLQSRAANLGYALHPSQTPQEFLAAFQERLRMYGRFPSLGSQIERIEQQMTELAGLYARRRYAPDKQSGGEKAWQNWQKMKRPLWLLCFFRTAVDRKK